MEVEVLKKRTYEISYIKVEIVDPQWEDFIVDGKSNVDGQNHPLNVYDDFATSVSR